jgi:hypothetical protein
MLTSLVTAARGIDFLTKVLLALIPLSGVAGGAIASMLIAGRKLYVTSITIERSKWIDKLRSNLAAYSAEILTYGIKNSLATNIEKGRRGLFRRSIDASNDLTDRFHKIEELSSIIQLQLNPNNQIDRTMIFLLRHCGLFFAAELKELNRFNGLLMQHSQWLLKAEWEKVKWEAGGIFYRTWHWRDAARRARAYRRFLSGEGSVVELVTLAIAYKTQKDMGLNWISPEEYEKWVANLSPKAPPPSWLRRKVNEANSRRIARRVREAAINAGLDLGRTENEVTPSARE